ncbi:hypothetical protein CFK38_07605 [Brachybacterium vulturis]|uniref:Uncharacterized protein n=1 Tax=Brachybacterium vulturis TaxID=2017484 RepID=A0A291GMZ0_9MICO|nr:hypothetical protein [Brachybacterium vulturis]ATG51406.1 hypothetical protein CFK38_07605 [Brachybacterium vulturis]
MLASVGLDGAADWLIGTLMESLSSSPAVTLGGAAVLIGSAISMAATFRRAIYNVSPQATLAYLLTLCLLIDLDQIAMSTALIGTAVAAIVVGLEHGTGPVQIEIVESSAPSGARSM